MYYTFNIKSDNKFPFISQNNQLAEAQTKPLLNLPFKSIYDRMSSQIVGWEQEGH